jgi:predicted O-methyltransferase YrrM
VQETWSAVDAMLEALLVHADDALAAALDASAAAGLPAIQVPPLQGKLLQLLARSIGARRILELGTLGGYSAIWLGRALDADGRMTTLELDPAHAAVARANLDRAGLTDRVEVRVGRAADLLPGLAQETFDFTFIDADKESTAAYFDWAVAHTRSGGLVVVDNVVRAGAVLDDTEADSRVAGVRRFFRAAAGDQRVEVTALQTVGSKGYDGMAVALVR